MKKFIRLTRDRTNTTIILNIDHIRGFYEVNDTTYIETSLQIGPLYVIETLAEIFQILDNWS